VARRRVFVAHRHVFASSRRAVVTHVVIAGGSGFLGRALARSLRDSGHTVSVLTRRPRRQGDVAWSPDAPGAWREELRRAGAVINLAGESIAGARWTPRRKALLRDSRVEPTRALARAILDSPTPPALLSGSAVGYYGTRGDEVLTEDAAPGGDFLAGLCRGWEAAALSAAGATRVVLLRTGVVLAKDGGALPQMAAPFRFFAGGPIGSGRQYMSWIHLDDWVNLVQWAMAQPSIAGPLNLTAAEPVTNAQFASTLGRALRRPAIIRMPAWPLRIALGEMADAAILNGQRVRPARALDLGFRFIHPRIDGALQSIYGR
jgi:uncharacterized protein (TIGR01777 family)